MFPVSSNFVNTPKRYDFSKCKDQRKTHFHEASKLGLQFSRNQWHVGTIGELDVEEGREGFKSVVVWWRSVVGGVQMKQTVVKHRTFYSSFFVPKIGRS